MCFTGIRKESAHLGIIDELSIIPVAGRDISPLDGDCSRPSGATACARKGSAMRYAFRSSLEQTYHGDQTRY